MKKQVKLHISPIMVLIIITFIVMIISYILFKLGVGVQKTIIVNGSLETSLVTINNVLSIDGIKALLGNIFTNFQLVAPLGLIIVSLITVTYMEYSGVLQLISKPFKKLNKFALTTFVLVVSLFLSFIGEYSYLILMPFFGLLYKNINKNPILGIITVFLGITIGYGTGFIFSANDYYLGKLTEIAATVEIDKGYKFNLFSNFFIMITSAFTLVLVLAYIVNKKVMPRLLKIKQEEIEIIEEKNIKKTIAFASLVFIILLLLLLYCVLPNLPYSGILLDQDGVRYVDKLFSFNAPFNEGLPFAIMFIVIISSYVYGKLSKTITKENNYINYIIKYTKGLFYILILLFFLSQILSLVSYTNIGELFASKLVTFMTSLEFSGVFLIITLFIVTVLISILIPDVFTKWSLMSPLIVPLFMRSNITPDFTLFVFKAADGIGKCFSPLFIYLFIMIGFVQSYIDKEKISILGIYKLMLPIIMVCFITLLIIIIGWFVINLPLGFKTYPTL